MIDDHLYSAILRSLEQTHCARLWFYMSDKLFIARFLNIHRIQDLTRERSRVAARARQLKRDKKVKDTWVRDGEICVKKNDDFINKLSTSRQLDVFG